MKGLNLSEWALTHRSMVLFLTVVALFAGVQSYRSLGRAEDPNYTLHMMVVRTQWPGATAEQVREQVTTLVERRVAEVPGVLYTKSMSRAGESTVWITIHDYLRGQEIAEAWRHVRRKLSDISREFPTGVIGPFPNDEFGDVHIRQYALTGDGYGMGALRDEADRMARSLARVTDVKKVELIGVQDEKIYIEVSPTRLTAMGLVPQQIFDALQRQNAIAPAGHVETLHDRLRLRVSGGYDRVEALRQTDLSLAGRPYRLGDIADVRRGLADPPQPRMRVGGPDGGIDAVGLGVVMVRGGNVLALGQNLDAAMAELERHLPVGIDVHVVADQPKIAAISFDLFMRSLAEAVLIVLAVSFLSLGLRTGAVVALSIPLVLALTFAFMNAAGIDLHRVSLGALIISLGLLVDDAIIAVEMMVVKMEQGMDRFRAATFAYTSTAFPMLTGTLITAAAFSPIGFARSSTGEYAGAIFWVVMIALVTSWFVAVIFTPWIGSLLLDPKKLMAKAAAHGGDPYQHPMYLRIRRIVVWCVRHRWWVIGATVASFALSIVVFNTVVQKQFFPPASRTELLVDLALPQGASLRATEADVHRLEALLKGDPRVASYSAYVGSGASRFFLSLDQQMPADNFAQFVVVAHSIEDRRALHDALKATFAAADGSWSHLRTRVVGLENGPPVGYPVQFRISGEDIATVRAGAEKIAAVMRGHPHLRDVNFDWYEQAKSMRIEINQARARALGVNSQDVALSLQAWLVGTTVTQFRENDKQIDIMWRAPPSEARSLDRLPDLDIATANGRHVSLAQVARLVPQLEDGLIYQRNRLPTITVRADIVGMQPNTASMQIFPQLAAVRDSLPAGYLVEMGGMIEESGKGEVGLKAVVPYSMAVVVTLLMMQLQSMSRTLLVLLSAPLGMIGVSLALVVSGQPYGFVANLGVLALMGMILRNSVILVDQIEQDEQAGKSTWDAIIDSTVRRFRPIVLTALAAVLAMIPLVRQIFWGPMATAIMGGLVVATVLTCLFLPALYAAWYRVRPDTHAPASAVPPPL